MRTRNSFPSMIAVGVLVVVAAAAFAQPSDTKVRVGTPVERKGDEIVVCGQLYHTGAPVVTWLDPGGYDAYRVERRFAPVDKSDWAKILENPGNLKSPNRYSVRKDKLSKEQLESVRGGGWNLHLLQQIVDQFVLHFDVCGTSKVCFKVLHDDRGLSVHFMLDVDGTIYQTLDLKERAWHATTSNSRSIGVEIAQIGAYRKGGDTLKQWYKRQPDGTTLMTIPPRFGKIEWRVPDFVPRPARNEPVVGVIQGKELEQYDFTPQQYDSLTKLTATLCTVFPNIKCDYPRDQAGKLIPHKLPDGDLLRYQGVLGHYHVQTNKTDPGPALDWEKLIGGAKKLMSP